MERNSILQTLARERQLIILKNSDGIGLALVLMTRTRESPCSSRPLLPSSPIRWKEKIDRRRSVPSSSFSDISRNTARHSPGLSRDCLRAAPCSWCCRSLPNPSWMSVSRTKTLDSSGSYS